MELLSAWARGLPPLLPGMGLLLALPLLLAATVRRPLPPPSQRGLAALLVLASLGLGLAGVWEQLALFDDAYISFRYARNFAEGHGLVWNVGERVEGYTNFLWTLLLGLLVRFTPWQAPGLGLGLSVAAFVGALLAAASVGRRLNGGPWLPLAVLLLALHPIFTAYGSTGMETGFCALLVLGGLRLLMDADSPRRYAGAGLVFILAALTRADHGIFYAVGSAVVGAEQGAVLLRAPAERRAALLRCLAWAAPFALYLAYLAWKLGYYGELLPNTYYAKSADMTWFAQGLVYSGAFWLVHQAWIPLLLGFAAAAWALARPRGGGPGAGPERRFAAILLGSVVLYELYVEKVGGDFMVGRFYVTLLPLVLLGAESLVFRLLTARGRWSAALACGLLLASSRPVPLFDCEQVRWGIVDENRCWPVTALRPEVEVDRVHYRLGRWLRDEVRARGLEPVLGSGGIGMVGYYSGLTLIDTRGLTDKVVARQELKKRRRPGHEKQAPPAYLRERGVQLLRIRGGNRSFHPERFRRITRLDLSGAGLRDGWQIARYDRELMEGLAAVPGVRFTDFPTWLDGYLAELPGKDKADVRRDLPWFRLYWFDHNEDPDRLAALEEAAR